ncbi:hypothetical protein BZA05DRAFT_373514 [Tricharina praecox]|uniref:uncharacterized protein n=1 Tax=Tricharina praecox TaxID=43433 RepID=UPI00221E7B1E|nr:uncharacterized protein BZA05DRAFT_373514 [Tricharina praecox]KAI5851822.1 hypothetical protein BZA05DRAFT_373514 [Tricharina praecox]
MCGRYVLYLSPSTLESYLRTSGLAISAAPDAYQPRYNIAPGQTAPVITLAPNSGENVSLQLTPMKWGVTLTATTPSATPQQQWTQINTRAETLAAPTGFWDRLKPYRCVVPSNGFYEWLPATGQPHHATPSPGMPPLLFAGLYDPSTNTYTIITTPSSTTLSFLHARMPTILSAGDASRWLNADTSWDALQPLLVPWEGGALEVYPVAGEVGKVGNDSPTFVDRVSERKDGIRAGLERQRIVAAAAAASPSKEKEKEKKMEKRMAEDEPPETPPPGKTLKKSDDAKELPTPTPVKKTKTTKSATSNAANRRSPKKTKKKPTPDGNRKITSFFK